MSDTPEVGRIRLLLALRPEVESIGRRDALILAEAVATLTQERDEARARAEQAEEEHAFWKRAAEPCCDAAEESGNGQP